MCVRLALATAVAILYLFHPVPLTAQTSPLTAQTSTTASTKAAAEPAAAAQRPEPQDRGVTFGWGDHLRIRIGENLRIDLRARVQADVRRSEAPIRRNADSGVDLARRRIGIDGEYANVLAFQIERELVDQPAWRDVYGDYRRYDVVRIKGGKFKLPFSIDENTSATDLDFAYRSLAATYLAPGRSWGGMVHGRLAERRVAYEAGVFRSDGDNARARAGTEVPAGGTVAARVTMTPMVATKTEGRTFAVGLAWTESRVDPTPSTVLGRTALRSDFLVDAPWVNGARRRIGVETQWLPGPASVKAEFIRVTQERRGQTFEGLDASPVAANGWYVSGTWALTGDAKADGLDTPERPFLRGGIGAIEVGARLEALTVGNGGIGEGSFSPRADVIIGNRDRVVTLGVNWYVNRWMKLQGNLIHDTLRDPSQGPLPTRPSFWSRVFRFQVAI
jgi:phosphate-selective porin